MFEATTKSFENRIKVYKNKRNNALDKSNNWDSSTDKFKAGPLVPLPPGHPDVECPVCLATVNAAIALKLLACDHVCCKPCLEEYFIEELNSSRVIMKCPQCPAPYLPEDVEALLHHGRLVDKYRERLLRYALIQDAEARWCPVTDCDCCVLAPQSCRACPKLTCPKCHKHFCYLCSQVWHTGKCKELGDINIKLCPRCRAPVEKKKDGGCNLMTCALCKTQFCWLCGKETDDLHFITPTGCSYWGTSRRNRRQIIINQIWQMIIFPVMLALAIVVAVPLIIIGLPYKAGKMTYSYFFWKKKMFRIALTLFSVTLAFVLSVPLLALIVAFGTIYYVFYTYLVIPYYLCHGHFLETTDENIPFLELPDEQTKEKDGVQEKHEVFNLDTIQTSPVERLESINSPSSIKESETDINRDSIPNTLHTPGVFIINIEDKPMKENHIKESAAANTETISLTLSIEDVRRCCCCCRCCCRRTITRKLKRKQEQSLDSVYIERDHIKETCCGKTVKETVFTIS